MAKTSSQLPSIESGPIGEVRAWIVVPGPATDHAAPAISRAMLSAVLGVTTRICISA
ncbi:MAG: hypothetical protein KKH72_08555 [Alphaproteobacteria bacterium]|nr:hypothetical protein [Alphaproteobacteria bacterium]